nr:MAG TPA: hypothetical protein [Caudoviricetes sp.]
MVLTGGVCMRLREMQEKAAPAKNPRSAQSSYDRPKPPSASEAVFLCPEKEEAP